MKKYKIFETGIVQKYIKTVEAENMDEALRIFMLSDNSFKNDNLISAEEEK